MRQPWGKLAGYGMNPKCGGANFAGGRSRPSLDGRKEGKRRSRPLPRPGKLAGYGMIPKRDGEGIAGVTDLLILAGIGEAEYVWIPIFFKGLKAFSCRQGRGVWHTPHRRPGHGANDFVRYVPNGLFGVIRGAYAIRPYSLPAGGVFSYG